VGMSGCLYMGGEVWVFWGGWVYSMILAVVVDGRRSLCRLRGEHEHSA